MMSCVFSKNGLFFAVLIVLMMGTGPVNAQTLPNVLTSSEYVQYDAAALISGMVDATDDSRFELLPITISHKHSYLLSPVADALKAMVNEAAKSNIKLTVVSGFRSYDYQQGIWNRKWKKMNPEWSDEQRVAAIMRYSSLPGISRHHWGTDFDLNSVDPAYWETPKGKMILDWLRAHASTFGFCEPYAGKRDGKRGGGYEDEAWHWSYKAIALPLQRQRAFTIQDVLHRPILGNSVVKKNKNLVLDYVNQVSSSCL